jgi:hypothetical protein
LSARKAIDMTEEISRVFLSQGILGAVSLLSVMGMIYLYLQGAKQRDRYESIIQKLNEDRIAELRAGMSTMGEAMQTVKTANSNFEAALDMLSKRQ